MTLCDCAGSTPFRLQILMKYLRASILVAMAGLLAFSACQRGGGTVRHGSLSFNASEVFGAGTPELALAQAAGRGDVKQIGRFAATGDSVNSVGQHGITPLWWAAWTRNYDGFLALLELGANPNAQTTNAPPVMHLIAD